MSVIHAFLLLVELIFQGASLLFHIKTSIRILGISEKGLWIS